MLKVCYSEKAANVQLVNTNETGVLEFEMYFPPNHF